MIDIHNHLLYGVDDGAGSLEEAKAMLEEAKSQGVTDIIFTPHYRDGMFPYPLEKVDDHFEQLKSHALRMGINVYPGCEYHVDSLMQENLAKGLVHTLADTDFVLVEFSYSATQKAMWDALSGLVMSGYTPIIAHIERCECVESDLELAWDFKELGALIQINADAVIGNDGRALKKTCKYLLKNELVDFVASDAHRMDYRPMHLLEAYKYISKKYSAEYAEELFVHNPAVILH